MKTRLSRKKFSVPSGRSEQSVLEPGYGWKGEHARKMPRTLSTEERRMSRRYLEKGVGCVCPIKNEGLTAE